MHRDGLESTIMVIRTISAFVLLATYLTLPLRGEETAVSVDNIRGAIGKALPTLESGSSRSASERQCFTCHSQAIPVFALIEASARGFKVDSQNTERQLKHTYAHLKRGVENYRQAKGQGGGILTAGYALLTLEAGRWPDDDTTAAVTHYLVEHQKEMKHWRQRGTRPPTSGSDYTATYVALRSLSYFGTDEQRESIAERRAFVAKWLSEHQPTDTEDHVFHMLSLPYIDAEVDSVNAATQRLLGEQRPDGGWGQTREMASDAYATGTVLYALLKVGRLDASHRAIQSGLAYLLKTQLDDGTWHVVTRAKPVQDYFESGFPHGVDQFISISATAWSTLALLLALPDDATPKNGSQSRNSAEGLVAASANQESQSTPLAATITQQAKYDLLVSGGRVVDGTGSPWYIADVAISAGKIAKIGRLDKNSAANVVDASGLVVSPGFIDMMGQTATPMMDDPKTAMNLLTQGITTINAGEGSSAAPLDSVEGKRRGWRTMSEYFALLDMQGLPVNVVQTVGHTQVRRIVLGESDRRPSDAELAQMRELVREAMQAGAIGVSTALIYPPAVYAQTAEIAALAEIAGNYGGGYFTHMRNEGDQLLEAIDEALEIGRIGKSSVHIFHLKTAGQQNWGKMELAIARIKAARAAGEQVTADIYPYVNNGLEIAAFIQPRHFTQGREHLRRQLDNADLRKTIRHEMETTTGWENWFRHVGHDWDRVVIGQTNQPRYREHVGQSIAKIAQATGEDPWDTFFNLVKAGAFALPQSMTEANKILAMRENFVSFCTDVGPASGDLIASHPRAFGSFPRMLSHYVRDLGAISLERAVAQASSTAANAVFAYDRGRISEGLAADVVVFDYQQLRDQATFSKPSALSVGVKHAIVNGQLVLKDGALTDNRPGRVLRGPGFKPETASHAVSTGKHVSELSNFDTLMRAFMQEHHVPGAAVAVTDRGRIVYARGFGYADLATKEPVQPTSLFRIASISKPITAVAIVQLAEQGKLYLEDKIFSVLDYETEIKAVGEAFDARLRDITIRHLLEHRGGWDRDKSFDGMFQSVRFAQEQNVPAPAGPHEVIRAMLRQPLDFNPGERYAYSNFGYCLLGRAIEKLSGNTYEEYVQQRVLHPLGIQSMRLGATGLEGRATGEVRYYHPGRGKSVFQADLGADVASPYGAWHLEAMDAHGGWLSSAVDLAKFAIALEDSNNSTLLSKSSLVQMHARPGGLAGHDEHGQPKDVYYSLGWQNRVVGKKQLNHWHTGSLPGSATILIRRHDGRNFVALFNSRVSPTAKHLGQALDSLLHRAADGVVQWP